jgi:hypothetical protein
VWLIEYRLCVVDLMDCTFELRLPKA